MRNIVYLIFIAAISLLVFAMLSADNSSSFWLEVKDQFQRRISKIIPDYDPVASSPGRLAKRLENAGLVRGAPVFIRIFKEESQLEVWLKKDGRYHLLHSYAICKWSGKLGPKLKEGDHQSPEGFYEVAKRQLNPQSRHHLSFNIGFPNAFDQSLKRTGSYLMVHGGCSSIGCYAVTDSYIDEIYSLVEIALNHGQKSVPVHIFPFRMSDERLSREYENQWYPFWGELKQGYDLFEKTYTLPQVVQCEGHYRFAQNTDIKCST